MPTTIMDRTELEKQIEWDNENDKAALPKTLTEELINDPEEQQRLIDEYETNKRSVDTYEFLYGTDIFESVRHSCEGRLFRYIFSKPEWALQLYNALTAAKCDDPAELSIMATDGYLNLEVLNGISLYINADMLMWESGSSYDPRMIVSRFPKAIHRHDRYAYRTLPHYYQKKLQPIPPAICYRFYNGGTDKPELEVVRLSEVYADGFEQTFGDKSDCNVFGKELGVGQKGFVPFDFAVIMVNLDHEKNQKILDECHPLREYVWFTTQVKQKMETFECGLSWSIDGALDQLPQDFTIYDHLMQHREAVFTMAYEDFCEQMFRGRKPGERQTRIDN